MITSYAPLRSIPGRLADYCDGIAARPVAAIRDEQVYAIQRGRICFAVIQQALDVAAVVLTPGAEPIVYHCPNVAEARRVVRRLAFNDK